VQSFGVPEKIPPERIGCLLSHQSGRAHDDTGHGGRCLATVSTTLLGNQPKEKIQNLRHNSDSFNKTEKMLP
jgi:hypothetical protein